MLLLPPAAPEGASLSPTGVWMACLLAACLASCARSLDPKLEAEGNYVAAQAAYHAGDFAEAHRRFAEVRRLNPGDPRLPAAEGEVLLSESRIDEALASFEQALQLDSGRSTTWSRLGYLYLLKNQPQKAQHALDTALAKNPRDFNALESLADLHLGRDEVDAGIENLVKASLVAPDRAKAELVLKAATELEKRGRAPEALGVLERASSSGVTSALVRTELGDLLVRAGRFADAVPAYTSAAEQSPEDPALWELVGELERGLGHRGEAKAAFSRSLEIEDRGVVHVALARLCQEEKDDACVRAELELALAKSTGEELRETLELAQLLGSLGRERDALALLRTASEEPEQKANLELQLTTARLAAKLKERATVTAACGRALSGGKAGVRCP